MKKKRKNLKMTDRDYISTLTIETVCHECGKTFDRLGVEWAYKRGERFFCSWHCMRAFDREKEEKK